MCYNVKGDIMSKNKALAVELIKKKLNDEIYLSYDEIAEIAGYHSKYILKLKREILDGSIRLEHGNIGRKAVNAVSDEEKQKIRELYKHSSVSISKFCKFYNKRCYSCIYNILHEDKDNQQD